MKELKYVLVNVDALREYVERSHIRAPNDHCKACGHEWPCAVYVEMKTALDRPFMSLVVSNNSNSVIKESSS